MVGQTAVRPGSGSCHAADIALSGIALSGIALSGIALSGIALSGALHAVLGELLVQPLASDTESLCGLGLVVAVFA